MPVQKIQSESTTPERKDGQSIENQSFDQRISDLQKKYYRTLDDAKNKARFTGGIAKAEWDALFTVEKNKIHSAGENYKKRRNDILAENRRERLEAFENDSLNEAENAFKKRTDLLNALIDRYRESNKLEEKQFILVLKALEGLEKTPLNEEAEKLFLKVSGSENLNREDYMKVLNMIKPETLINDLKGSAFFETAEMGVIVAVMDASEKMQLARYAFDVYSKKNANDFVRAMATHGQLTISQLNSLLENPAMDGSLRESINDGSLAREQEIYHQSLCVDANLLKSRTAESNALKLSGTKGIFALTALWGGATALLNLAVEFDKKDILGSLGRGVTSPWFLTGTAVAAGSALALAPTFAPGISKKGIEWLENFFAGPEGRKRLSEAKLQEIKENMAVPLDINPHIISFLETEDYNGKSGFDILVDTKKQKGQGQDFTLEDIRNNSSEDQKNKLEQALKASMGDYKEKTLTKHLNCFVKIAIEHSMTDKVKMKEYLTAYRNSRNI